MNVTLMVLKLLLVTIVKKINHTISISSEENKDDCWMKQFSTVSRKLRYQFGVEPAIVCFKMALAFTLYTM